MWKSQSVERRSANNTRLGLECLFTQILLVDTSNDFTTYNQMSDLEISMSLEFQRNALYFCRDRCNHAVKVLTRRHSVLSHQPPLATQKRSHRGYPDANSAGRSGRKATASLPTVRRIYALLKSCTYYLWLYAAIRGLMRSYAAISRSPN